MTDIRYEFATDLTPEENWPRVRFNFDNGWTASVIFKTGPKRPYDAMQASVASWPSGQHGTGKTVIHETEATADEVAELLDTIRKYPPPGEAA